MSSPKFYDRALLLISIFAAITFAGAGFAKVIQSPLAVESFRTFELPQWLMVYVGLFEVFAAGLLLRRATRWLGSIIGIAICVVAIPAHLNAEQTAEAIFPSLYLFALIFVAWRSRASFFSGNLSTGQ